MNKGTSLIRNCPLPQEFRRAQYISLLQVPRGGALFYERSNPVVIAVVQRCHMFWLRVKNERMVDDIGTESSTSSLLLPSLELSDTQVYET